MTGTMHFGRLPDFSPRLFGKFLAEAEQQTLSLPKLEIALEAILGAVAERQIPLGLVAQWARAEKRPRFRAEHGPRLWFGGSHWRVGRIKRSHSSRP